jgi:hypothetical protein
MAGMTPGNDGTIRTLNNQVRPSYSDIEGVNA